MSLLSSDTNTSDIGSSSIDADGSRNIELQCYHFLSRTENNNVSREIMHTATSKRNISDDANVSNIMGTNGNAKGLAKKSSSNSLQSNGTMSTDTMGSTYTFSDDNNRPITKRKGMQEDRLREGEPTKKKARPLFNKKSGIESDNNNNNHSAKVVQLKKKGRSSKLVGKRKANGGERSITLGSNKSAIKSGEEYFTIQQLLSLARQRKLEAQSKLSLVQLKQQAREKARANANRVQVQQTSRRKTTRNGKRHKPKSSLAKKTTSTEESIEVEDEPVDTIDMNTGTLYLYRGLKPRAEFVWK